MCYYVPVPSAGPSHVQCSPLSSTSLLLRWEPPPREEINGRLTEYRIFFRPLKEWEGNRKTFFNSLAPFKAHPHVKSFITERVEILEQSTLQHEITLGGLEKYQNYSVQVAAATKVGLGLKSRSIYCRTLEDGEGNGERGDANIRRTVLVGLQRLSFSSRSP